MPLPLEVAVKLVDVPVTLPKLIAADAVRLIAVEVLPVIPLTVNVCAVCKFIVELRTLVMNRLHATHE